MRPSSSFRRGHRAPLAGLVAVLLLAAGGAAPWSVQPVGSLDAYAQEVTDDAGETRRERRRNREAEPADAEVAAAGTPAPVADDDTDCIDFPTQEQAQAVLDGDPSDPFNLDPNGDGVACSTLPTDADIDPIDQNAQTTDETERPRRNRDTDGAARQAASCDTLTQEEAQDILDADPSDPQGLDPDADGIACETGELEPADGGNDRSARRDRNRDDEPVDVSAPPADLDCANFAFQDEAQLVLDDDPDDPYNLDPNDDGFACTSLPSRLVAVSAVPSTGSGQVIGATIVAEILLTAAAATAMLVFRRRSV